MTRTHYKSKDEIIEIVITDDDCRHPRHGAPMAVVKLHPKPHTRVRNQWGGVTAMFCFSELRALAEAIAICDPKFTFSMTKTAEDKPESRKLAWQRRNLLRVARNKSSHSRKNKFPKAGA